MTDNLPDEVVRDVVGYFDSFLSNGCVAPDKDGKRAFFRKAVARIDFLPQELQSTIDRYRGDVPQAEYLLSQFGFSARFSYYL